MQKIISVLLPGILILGISTFAVAEDVASEAAADRESDGAVRQMAGYPPAGGNGPGMSRRYQQAAPGSVRRGYGLGYPYADQEAYPYRGRGAGYGPGRRGGYGYGYPGYRGRGGSGYPGHRQYGNPPFYQADEAATD